ncbi:MAG: substrate-binding domain-containing protein [Mycobacterium sp.]
MTRRCIAVAAAAIVVLSPAGCSGSDGAESDTDSRPAPPRQTVAFVTHQAPSDTFWDLVRRGAEAAADQHGLELQYLHDPDPAIQARHVVEATEHQVSGLAVTLATPEPLADSVRAAVAAEIPVMAVNSGIGVWRELGVLAYFGQDDGVAGQEVGRRLDRESALNVLCVIQDRGHVGLESRCDGAAQTFSGVTDRLYVDGTRPQEIKADLINRLQQDRSIDRVLTLSAPVALTALQAIGEANSYAKVVTFDTNTAVIEAVTRGTIEWAVDQQPFLQGYLAVDALWLYLTNKNIIGGGLPTLTGPSFVDESNVDAVAERAEEGTR